MNANYACLSSETYREGKRCLVAWRGTDIDSVRRWRNEQIEVLRQKSELSPEDQQNYFRDVIVPTFAQDKPRQLLFSYLENDVLIGYGGLVHIDWEMPRGEISFLMETKRAADPDRYAEDFQIYFNLLARIAFDELGFHRMTSETFDIRPVHVKVLESFGFRREGRLREHVMVRGKAIDSILHGLLRDEWRKSS